jgi:hypothetical protein
MAEFTGKFQYLNESGSVLSEGQCRFLFDKETATLTPASGAPIVFDLGDLNAVLSEDWEIRLPLYTGRVLVMRQLGHAYETLAHDLLEAYRDRAVQCLLLEDLEELERFPATLTASGEAELRLYKTNLAVFPLAAQAFQWRLADIDSVEFNSENYEVVIQARGNKLAIRRLGKRTEEFVAKLREAIAAVAAKSSRMLHDIFPFLNPDQLRAVAGQWHEGGIASVQKLAEIHAGIVNALSANAVDSDLKPYYEYLLSRTVKEGVHAGFKLIKAETAAESGGGESKDEVLYWFLFPLGNVVAWEASSKSGRATYFFQQTLTIDELNRTLGMLNFRRRPIYLSDEDFASDPQYRRYAIATRQLPELQRLRKSFSGRAMHSTVQEWQSQVASILNKAAAPSR